MKITKIRHTKIKNLVSISRDYLERGDAEPPKGFITLDIVPNKEAIGDELFIALINFSNIVSHIERARQYYLKRPSEPNAFVFDEWRQLFECWASYVSYWNDKAFNDGFPESVGSKLLWAWKKDKSMLATEISPKTRQIFFPESQ